MTDEKRKTLTLGGGVLTRTPSGTGSSTVKIERRRRIVRPSSEQAGTASGNTDKLKALLEQAKQQEKEAVQKAEEQAKLNEKRRAEAEKAEKEVAAVREKLETVSKEKAAEKVVEAQAAAEKKDRPSKTFKKPITSEAPVMEQKEAAKKTKKDNQAEFGRRKLTVNDIILHGDEDDEATVITTRQKSLASLQRRLEKQKQKQHSAQKGDQKVVREVSIPETITVKDLAERMSEKGADVVKKLMAMGVMATINQVIDADTAQLIVEEFGHTYKRVGEGEMIKAMLASKKDSAEDLEFRAPVVTIMGHVDHGKTTLLDALRETDVAGGEAGGITQHIGAYQVKLKNGKKISFIDTPGHAAFSSMRARGANITDVVVLVVAANDGIMPQTVEAISHAKSAGVPIIVAVNKIDLPEADPHKVRMELLQHEVVTEGVGGDTLSIDISAKKRLNLDALEEAILLQAEMLELKANPNKSAEGVVVEAKVEKGLGSTATVLIQNGTLKIGDVFVSGMQMGRVRALQDSYGNRITEALPSEPVMVLGLQGTPEAGDDFVVLESESKAREIAEYRQKKRKEKEMILRSKSRMEALMAGVKEGEVGKLPIVIKGDVQGSIEAIVTSLEKMGGGKVQTEVVHAGVGGINESDITLARATNALVIGFNVRANPQARDAAKAENIDIRYYSIIYDLTDDIKKAMEGMLDPEIKETFIGYAEVKDLFSVGKGTKVAGCIVTEGIIKRDAKIRLIRNDVVMYTGDIGQLKRFKDDVKEVREGQECGLSFQNYNDLSVGDRIECYTEEKIDVKL